MELPSGFIVGRVVMSATHVLYVSGKWSPRGRSTILRADSRRESVAWDDLRPPTLGGVLGISLDGKNHLWIGGEWRDVFKLEDDDRWTREVTPLPLHNESLKMNADGTGWILASSRTRSALMHRSEAGWKTVAIGDDRFWDWGGLLFADENEAIVQGPKGIERIPAPGRAVPPRVVSFPGYEDGFVALSSPETGWAVMDGTLCRIDRAGRHTVHVTNRLPVRNLHDFGTGGLWGRDSATDTYVLLSPEAASTPLGLEAAGLRIVEARRALAGGGRIHGLAVFSLRGKEYLYCVDHEGLNPTLPLSKLADPAALVNGTGWEALSVHMGTQDLRRGKAMGAVFDSAALSADLDGDDKEDLILVSMYDGIRVYRNERDDHFALWETEAGVQCGSTDLPTGACLLDADGDGDLDLYVANGLATDRLHLNNGAGSFRDVTKEAGIATHDGGSMPACSDLDGDGDVDVAVATGARGLLVQENLGVTGGIPRFREHRTLLDREDLDKGPGLSTVDLSSLALADVDGDGLPEIFAATANGCDRFFRNEGELKFRDDPGFLPPDQPCAGSVGAEWVDLNEDGHHDLVVTGRGGTRVYLQEGGKLVWVTSPTWEAGTRAVPLTTRPAVVADFDDDGDLDLFQGTDGGGLEVYRNLVDRPSDLILRLDGPPGNRSAVGARIAFKRVSDGRIAAWREISGGSGSGSHSSKWVHLSGVEPNEAYDIEVRLPGRAPEVVGRVHVPFRGMLTVGPTGVARTLGAFVWRTTHFFGNPWHRRWAGFCVIALLGSTVLASILFRGIKMPFAGVATLASIPIVAFGLLVGVPLDTGPNSAMGSALAATALASTLLAIGRSRMRVEPLPEMLCEMGLALRSFQHNQTPQRILQALQFDLRNVDPTHLVSGGEPVELLKKDARLYREVVLPQLVSLARLAHSAELPSQRAPKVIREQARILDRICLVGRDGSPGGRFSPKDFLALTNLIQETEQWLEAMREEVDRRQALDLGEALADYVGSRRPIVACSLRFVNRADPGLVVRCLPADLERLLDALLENAVRANRGDREKNIRIELGGAEDRRAIVRFHDDGPGVDEAMRSRLFGYGASGTPGGHGLGLYMARRTLQRFGGTIELDAAVTEGACFRLEFDVLTTNAGPRREVSS